MKKILLVFVSVLALSLISGCCCDKVCAAEKPAAKAKKHMIIGSWMIEDLPAATAKKSLFPIEARHGKALQGLLERYFK